MTKVIYKDKYGNKLFAKKIKSRKITQYYAKNKKGRLVSSSGLRTMLKRAKIKMRVPTKMGIHRVRMYRR